MPRPIQIPVIPNTDPHVRGHIRALIRLLLDENDNTSKQLRPLYRENLAEDMRNREGHVLDAIYHCVGNGVPPTMKNVVDVLMVNRRLENPAEFVNALYEENKELTQGIRSLSMFISDWLQERELKQTSVVIGGIADDPYAGYADKWDQAYNLLMRVNPMESFVHEDVEESSFMRLTFERNQEVIKARAAGLSYGITFPFEATKAYLPSLEWGQATAVLGGTGVGKTTWAQIMAEHIAWNSELECDVVYFALESPLNVLSLRQFSRHQLIPYNAVKSGEIDLSSSKWKSYWNGWEKSFKERSNTRGHIRYFYSPDATVTDIAAAMSRAAEVSRRLGRKIVFVIDHLHSIDWEATHSRMSEFDALRSIIRTLSARVNNIAASGVKTHLIIMAQEGNEKGQAFGGKFLAKRTQLVISLQRERFGAADENGNFPLAPTDLMITAAAKDLNEDQKKSPWWAPSKEDKNIYISMNALGQPRYSYRKGDEYSHKGIMRITKSNDSAPFEVRTLWEASMNIIKQDPAQVAELRKNGQLPPLGVK